MIKNRLGFSFATPIILLGVVITLAGILALFENLILGAALVVIGPFFWSSSYGSQIDTINQRFREYGSFYGIKSGEWKSLDILPDISVIKSKEGMTVYSRSNRSTSYIEDKYNVCLLNKTHRKRMTVQKFDTFEQAKTHAQELAIKLKKKLVTVNPQVSEKTRNRRMFK